MDDLKKYVDNMFSKYKETNQIKELKYEVLRNLKSKITMIYLTVVWSIMKLFKSQKIV